MAESILHQVTPSEFCSLKGSLPAFVFKIVFSCGSIMIRAAAAAAAASLESTLNSPTPDCNRTTTTGRTSKMRQRRRRRGACIYCAARRLRRWEHGVALLIVEQAHGRVQHAVTRQPSHVLLGCSARHSHAHHAVLAGASLQLYTHNIA